jgi:protein-S-isoprenylcysteine O-methyltransferase Ste14
MDTFRYGLALFLVMLTPGAFLYWFSIHPFIGFWRRVGTKATLVIHYAAILASAGLIYWFRRALVFGDLHTNWFTVALAVPLLVVSAWLRRTAQRHLKWRILLGVPELEPAASGGKLLTEGIYARMRNPRYGQATVGLLGDALVANYLSGYLLVLFTVLAVLVIVRFEEKELRARFGGAFDAYCARVPRYIPRFGRSPQPIVRN